MESRYCIYLNKHVSENELNLEHIIPLSLGGSNEFVIPVHAETNKRLGSQVDGRLTKDYIISSIRRQNNLKGHSKKTPSTKITNSRFQDTGEPLQVLFEGKSGSFYNPKSKTYIPNHEMIGRNFEMNIKIDRYARPMFIAKTLLASGYYVFGDLFVNHTDHDSLRKLMNFEYTETIESLSNLPLEIHDPLFGVASDGPNIKDMYDKICKSLQCSCIKFLYYDHHIIGSVGIAGTYLGSIRFEADLSKLPQHNNYEHGHIVGIQDNQVRRNSVRKIVNLCFGSGG